MVCYTAIKTVSRQGKKMFQTTTSMCKHGLDPRFLKNIQVYIKDIFEKIGKIWTWIILSGIMELIFS